MKVSDSFIEKYRSKKILIVGMGKSGVAAMEVFADIRSDIFAYDSNSFEATDERLHAMIEEKCKGSFLGGKIPYTAGWDYIVMSPGVPPSTPFILDAINNGAKLTGDLELGFEACDFKFVGITGTNGKTTTTTLVGEIFKAAGVESEVAGNIGRPVILCASTGKTTDEKVLITEISSFQLETIDEFRPHIAAFLNLTPDHLDRHGSIEAYGDAKARIFEKQTEDDYLVYNYDDPEVSALVDTAKSVLTPFSRKFELEEGVFVKDGSIIIADRDNGKEILLSLSELKIPGNHNVENALAAVAIAVRAGIDKKVIAKVLSEFMGVEHRMELAGEIDGVKYVNDSKGTNPEASEKAIEATEKGVILIAGGYNKNSDFHNFIKGFRGKVKNLVLLGDTANVIYETAIQEGFENVEICSDMEDCVRVATSHASVGDTVLLSPACASWDMYKSFEERGDHFKGIVRELMSKDKE